MQQQNYKERLKDLMDKYVHLVYQLTKTFPKDEIYGLTSQFRRSSLSIMLNYIEGYARRKPLVQLNFFEISYGSLQESKYLLFFSLKENLIKDEDYEIGIKLAEEIGAMLWTEIKNLDSGNS